MSFDQNLNDDKENNGMSSLADKAKKFFIKSGPSPNGEVQLYSVRIIVVVLLALALLWSLAGIYIIGPAEEGVILRLGKYLKTEGPGPHWRPAIIDNVTVINVERVSTYPYQAEMLTEDENIVSVGVAVQYRVADAEDFLFRVVDPLNTLFQATSSALRQAVGQVTLNDVLTTGRENLRNEVAKQLRLTLAGYRTGLQIMDVTLQATKPPDAVIDAFNDAIKAREDSQRFINESQTYARRVLLSAQGTISRLENDALAYKQSVVFRAKGDVARYNAFLKPYKAAPKLTSNRLYLDTISDVMSQTSNILVEGSNNLLYLPLDKIIKMPKKTD